MLTVCNFHYIRDSFIAPFPSIFGVTPSEFENQIKELSKTGEFINQERLISETDFILTSEKNYILITFDDGLQEQFLLAKPVLDKHKIEAVYYINSLNFIDNEVSLVHKIHLLRSQVSSNELLFEINKRTNNSIILTSENKNDAVEHYNYDDLDGALLKYLLNFKIDITTRTTIINDLFSGYFKKDEVISNLYMSKNQLEELSFQNMLGNHTHNHLALGLLSAENIIFEINKTKNFIDSFGQKKNHTISYPFGSAEACKAPVSTISKNLGYSVGFTMERGINSTFSNKLLLKRFDCNDLVGGKNVIEIKK